MIKMENTIVIGKNICATKDYQLLVDVGDIKIDKIMNEQEYELISSVVKAVFKLKVIAFFED
jgi:predicted cupin superfamily sugar epimerase